MSLLGLSPTVTLIGRHGKRAAMDRRAPQIGSVIAVSRVRFGDAIEIKAPSRPVAA